MEIRVLDISEKEKLEDFLVLNGGEAWRSLGKSYIDCMFSKDFRRPTFLVAVNGDEIVGCAAFSEEFFTVGVWGISWVNVCNSQRNKGLGKTLVEACLVEIEKRTRESVTVILNTYPNKTGLYDKVGFKPAGNDYAGGSLMVKYLEKVK